MEQKWKVKNLLFDKKLWNSGIFTVILCILGGILCGCAMLLLLIKSPILAADDGGDMIPTIPLTYRGVDDKVEVLDRLSFMYTGEDDQMTVVTEMYQEGKNLYVVPKPLIVNVSLDSSNPYKNIVGTGVWGNILGGRGNEVYSDNVTLVGGQGNKVESGNANATLLGGKGNEIQGGNESPIIMMGGEGNSALENKGVNVVIGGLGSRVSGTEGVNVVGGSNITVEGGSNVIVGGSNVSVGGDVDNVFIFSPGNDSFIPDDTDGDNAFYLDVDNGLGLNTPGRKGGVESMGAVSFGEIDIDTNCGEADLGVEGVWDGCLVGCTRASLDGGGKWEMLDQGTDCIEKCEANPKCTTADDNNTVIPYNSFCTTGAISTENAYMCDTGALADHENVVFETTLIDSENNCPNGENKCVYKCNESYHLTGDKTGKPNSINKIACYSDCDWTGANGEAIKIKHNEMVTGYNTDQAFCSVDNFDFGKDNETDHDTCGKHKKTLICVDGTMYIADEHGEATDQTAASTNPKDNYTIEKCTLKEFRCNTGEYGLIWRDITGELNDTTTWTGGYLNKRDGKRVKGEKGIYKLCINYDPASNPNGEHCDEKEPYTFRLVGCMSGYKTGEHHPGECRKEVKLVFEYVTNKGDGNVWFKWTGNYNSNTLESVTKGYSTGLIGPDAPVAGKTKDGAGDWIFVGWNTNKDAHEGLTGFEMPDDNFTLHAIYTKAVTATFSGNGTGIEVIPPTTGGCVMWNSDTGCSFTGKYDFNVIGGWNWIKDGWNTDKDAHGSLFSGGDNVKITIDRDVNFYTISHMPRKVIFYKNGAEKLDPETGPNTGVSTELWCDWYNNQSQLGTGCKVITPKIIRSGWKALGWGDDSNGTGIKFKVNTGLYTKEGTRAYYAITKRALTGNFDPNRDATYNQYALFPDEWIHRDKELCDIYNLETGCNITTQVFNTTERYLPRGWTLYTGDVKSAADVKGLDTEVRLTGDTVFYAQVKSSCMTGDEEDLQTVKVTYNVKLNKGSAVILPDGTKVNGDYSLYALPGSMLTGYKGYKSGWTFVGWSTKTGQNERKSLTGVQVQCDEVKLYALFKKTCEVFFNPNGGTIYSSGYYMGNKIATGSCFIWNRNNSCSVGISSPQVISGISTPTPLGFSLGANDHEIVWSGNTIISPSISGKWIRCGETYYAQTKRDVKLIFDKNGNKGTDKTIRACTYYNTGDACTTDDIKSQKCIPFTGYEVIGWSTAADRHENDWPSETTGGKLKLTGDTTYYCQSEKDITVKFNPNGNIISGSDESSCTGYNGSGCEIKAPDCTPATGGYRVIGWSSATGKHVNEWSIGSGKIFTTSGTYYCQSEKDIMVTFNPNGNRLSGSVDGKVICTGYNGSGCEIKAIDFIPATGYTQTGWSTATGKHVNEWPIGSGKIFTKSGTYYAQSYKDITVTFDSNGNTLTGSNTSTCTGYNGSGCEIKAKDFKPYAGHTKIGWSSATGKHINEWSPGTGKIFTTSGTYYAQSYKVYTLKFNSTDGCAVSGTDKQYWTGYNGKGGKTGFISPGVRSQADWLGEGWNTGVYLDTGYWQVNTSKIIEFSSLSTGVQYYAQCRKEENGKCGDCVYGCASGTMVKTGSNDPTRLAKWMCIGRDGDVACAYQCGADEVLRGNDTDGWGCKKSCNTCAKNGFPYCFPIDFTASCTEEFSSGSSCGPITTGGTTCNCFGNTIAVGEHCYGYKQKQACTCPSQTSATCLSGGSLSRQLYQSCTSGVGCTTGGGGNGGSGQGGSGQGPEGSGEESGSGSGEPACGVWTTLGCRTQAGQCVYNSNENRCVGITVDNPFVETPTNQWNQYQYDPDANGGFNCCCVKVNGQTREKTFSNGLTYQCQ